MLTGMNLFEPYTAAFSTKTPAESSWKSWKSAYNESMQYDDTA